MTDSTTPDPQEGLVEQYRKLNTDDHDHCDGHHNAFDHFYESHIEPHYHTTVRFISGLGERFVGTANAGRLGTASRVLRWVVLGIYMTAFTLMLLQLGVTGFFTGGLPLWLMALPYIGLMLSSVGIVMGTAGNTLKIEQYYGRQLELLAEANHLRAELRVTIKDQDSLLESKKFPHTLQDLWDVQPSLYWSRIKRKVHDMNGILGTLLGMVTTGVDFLTKVAGVCLVVISPVAAFVTYAASRVSTILSVTIAPYTNWERLKENKKLLVKYEDQLLELAHKKDPARAKQAKKAVEDALSDLQIDLDNTYTKRVSSTLIMTLFNQPSLDISRTPDILKELLSPLISNKRNRSGEYPFSRTALRKIDTNNEFTPKVTSFSWRNRLSPIDAMPVLGFKLLDAYYKKTVPDHYQAVSTVLRNLQKEFHLQDHSFNVTFLSELRFTLLAMTSQELINIDPKVLGEHLREYSVLDPKTNRWNIDPETVADSFPTGNAIHGRLAFVPYFHSKRLVEKVIAASQKAAPAVVESNIAAAKDLIVKSPCTYYFKKKCEETLEAMRAKRVTQKVGEKRLAKSLAPLVQKGADFEELDKGLQRAFRK